jgi:acyl-CoA synthetase (AMP-forming)/AMP-acid ligase II
MLGLMQDWPLLCHRIIEHAAAIHGNQEVVTRSVEGPVVRTTYKQIHERALRVSQALDRVGITLGDRIATIAWNTARHLECWYGIMGIGAICLTVNPRLFPEQIAWIVNHAKDRVVITDLTFVPMLEQSPPGSYRVAGAKQSTCSGPLCRRYRPPKQPSTTPSGRRSPARRTSRASAHRAEPYVVT